MIKVLIVIDKLSMDGRTPSCIAINIRDSYEYFLRSGCRIEICNIRGEDPGAALLEAAGCTVYKLGLSPFSPLIYRRLVALIEESGAELVHAHGYSAADFGRLAAARKAVPAVIHEHAILPLQPHQFIADALLRPLTERAVAVSGAVADFLVHGRRVPRKRVVVIHNGIDLEKFRKASEVNELEARRKLQLPEKGLLIGCAARFRKEKGQLVLLDAFQHLLQDFNDMRLVLAGDGPDYALLEARTRELCISDNVVFAGFIDDMPLLLRALSMLVIPSFSEGFSFAAVEAMAVGCPVVASGVGGLLEVVSNEQTGLHVPPGDTVALAEALRRVLSDSALREKIVIQARRDVDRFSMKAYVDNIVAMYDSVLSA